MHGPSISVIWQTFRDVDGGTDADWCREWFFSDCCEGILGVPLVPTSEPRFMSPPTLLLLLTLCKSFRRALFFILSTIIRGEEGFSSFVSRIYNTRGHDSRVFRNKRNEVSERSAKLSRATRLILICNAGSICEVLRSEKKKSPSFYVVVQRIFTF